jgi:hypothetical protein
LRKCEEPWHCRSSEWPLVATSRRQRSLRSGNERWRTSRSGRERRWERKAQRRPSGNANPRRSGATTPVQRGRRWRRGPLGWSQNWRAWCGTHKGGMFRSDDRGRSWHSVGLAGRLIMAVTASPVERDVVWVGTEPSEVWRSGDAGTTWEQTSRLERLSSSSEWSFPPRPDTGRRHQPGIVRRGVISSGCRTDRANRQPARNGLVQLRYARERRTARRRRTAG